MPLWITKVESDCAPTVVCARLREVVRPRKGFWQGLQGSIRIQPDPFQFEGSIDGKSFRVQRIIGYRNSFRPIILGSITEREGGSIIWLTMAIHPAVAIFMAFFLGRVLQPLLTGAIPLNDGRAFIVVVMAAFGALLVTVAFSDEARKAKQLLGDLLGDA